MDYLEKYLKYKKKYFDLRTTVEKKSSNMTNEINMIGGNPEYIQFTSIEDASQKT